MLNTMAKSNSDRMNFTFVYFSNLSLYKCNIVVVKSGVPKFLVLGYYKVNGSDSETAGINAI